MGKTLNNKPRLVVVTTVFTDPHFNFRAKLLIPYMSNLFDIHVIEILSPTRCKELNGPIDATKYRGIRVTRVCGFTPHDLGHMTSSAWLGWIARHIISVTEKFKPDAVLATPLHAATIIPLEKISHATLTVYEDVDRFRYFFRGPTNLIVASLEKFLLRVSDVVIAVTPKLYSEDLRVRLDKPTHFIPNGVDTEVFKQAMRRYPKRRDIMVYVGSIEWWSGIEPLIDIVYYLNKMSVPVRLVIAGKLTPYAREIVVKAKKLGLWDNIVRLIGPIPHLKVPELLARAGIGVALFPQTPLLEMGVPLKLLEYLAAGLPVLTTTITYIGKLIAREGAGIVVEPNEEPEEIASKLIELMDNDVKYNEASSAAQKIAKMFDLKHLALHEAQIILSYL